MKGVGLDACALAYPYTLLAPGAAFLTMLGVGLQASAAAPQRALALLAGGLLAWTLLEYLLHRFVLHGFGPFRRWHAEHHRQPDVPLRTPLAFSVPLLLLLVALPYLLSGAWPVAAPLSGGLLLGQLMQETVHHLAHRAPPSAGRWLAARRAQHLFHHLQDERRAFGTLTAVWDRLFGTAMAVRS